MGEAGSGSDYSFNLFYYLLTNFYWISTCRIYFFQLRVIANYLHFSKSLHTLSKGIIKRIKGQVSQLYNTNQHTPIFPCKLRTCLFQENFLSGSAIHFDTRCSALCPATSLQKKFQFDKWVCCRKEMNHKICLLKNKENILCLCVSPARFKL